jgi:hypothetical protein
MFIMFFSIHLSIYCQMEREDLLSVSRAENKVLRQFSISAHQMKIMRENVKLYELWLERKNTEKLKEEAMRRKIYTEYLLAYQRGSSVLRDFHTNLYRK